jgi:hypothetical protein
MSDAPRPQPNGGSRPVPDPTTLTTEALQREIKALGERVKAEADGLKEFVLAKMDGHAQDNCVRFGDIKERFVIIEAQRVEQKNDTQKAVDAALQAQKEAVREQTLASDKAINKSETGMIEQLKQQNATTAAHLTAISDKITDLTNRVGTIEAVKLGGQEMKAGARLDLGTIISLVVMAIVVASFFVRGP